MAIDQLKEVVLSLNKEELKEFRIFSQRQRVKQKRKDLELFELLVASPTIKPIDLILKLYGKENREAYNMLRKRLIKQLTDFITVKRMDEDKTDASKVMGTLSLAQHLFGRNHQKMAWGYLMKAEVVAQKSGLIDLLDNVYNLQIENWHPEHSPPLNDIIDGLHRNNELAVENENMSIAITKVKYVLHQHKMGRATKSLQPEIDGILEQHNVKQLISKKPKFLHGIASIIRSGAMANKNLTSFEEFAIGRYKRIEDSVGFSASEQVYKIELLYMIAHAQYRNRKFKESLKYLALLNETISANKKSFYKKYHPKFLLLEAGVNSYIGNNDTSIKLLDDYLKVNETGMSIRFALDFKLNLAVYYFQKEDFSQSNKMLMNLHHSDAWCQKKMGREWVMRKNLIDVLGQYERENHEIALQRVKSFKQSYNDMLAMDVYKRVNTFLHFIEHSITHPEQIASAQFFDKVNDTLERLPLDKEDLQAMAFYCWLKSKMLRRPYYEVLVETVNE